MPTRNPSLDIPTPTYNAGLLQIANRYKGLQEYPGAKHNETILNMFETAGHGWVQDDETPWCAAFVAQVLSEAGLQHTGKLNAKSYLTYGAEVPLAYVMPGDVAVGTRGDPNGPYGHVAFVVRFERDQVLLRGGNQGNQVSDAWYDVDRIISYRRPSSMESTPPGEIKDRLVKLGHTGVWVGELQGLLAAAGYNPGPIDEHFGDMTEQAVMHMQRLNGLKVDGVVGPRTWEKLRSPELVSPPLRKNVTEASLRADGSTTIILADQAEETMKTGARIGFGTGIVDTVFTYTEKLKQLGGSEYLTALQQTVIDNWLILLLIAGTVFLYFYGSRVAGALRLNRVEDAVLRKNIGR